MKTLRLPDRSVGLEDFRGGYAVCQNLLCLCPIEPPVHTVTLESAAGPALHTVLCCRCVAEAKDAADTVFEVVEAEPVLELPG
jgi:hypothetical protein